MLSCREARSKSGLAIKEAPNSELVFPSRFSLKLSATPKVQYTESYKYPSPHLERINN